MEEPTVELFVQRREVSSLIGDADEAQDFLNQMDTITQFTLKVWYDIICKHKLEPEIRILRWPAYDKQFITNTQDQTFKHWVSCGITGLCTIIKQGRSFQD